jgi:hypothetical protein
LLYATNFDYCDFMFIYFKYLKISIEVSSLTTSSLEMYYTMNKYLEIFHLSLVLVSRLIPLWAERRNCVISIFKFVKACFRTQNIVYLGDLKNGLTKEVARRCPLCPVN